MDYDYSIVKKKGKKNTKPVIFFAILICFFVLLVNNLLSPKKAFQEKPDLALPGDPKKIQSKEELDVRIKEIINNKPGSYSIYVNNLVNNDSFGINENLIFTAASVNKIEILAALYYLADKNKTDLDRTITLQKEDIQDYGTGSLRYEKPGTTYSVKTLARLMMEKSDNTAAYLIGNQLIGLEKIQSLINEWGLKQTDIVNNKTSNTDQEKMLRMIYQGKIANQALTTELLDLLNDSDFENRIPQGVPSNIKIYHKIGTEIRNIHDVGIVDIPNQPYYIGVLTTDNPNDEEAIQIISEISKVTYEYFTR